jgi:hypothetical protein
LARQFVAGGWSQKSLHRLIVSSATYRQASHARDNLAAADPLNLLLGRQNRVRLDAEIIRDAALSASGKFSDKIGGPSVYPPQPDGVYAFTQNRKNWQTATGNNRFRRAMYTMFYRSAPYPTLTTFDAPDFQSVCTRRVRSNTPLQALTMANDAAMYELAEGFADRILAEGAAAADAAARIERAFLIAFCRRPSVAETAAVQLFLDQQRADAAVGTVAASASTAPAIAGSALALSGEASAAASAAAAAADRAAWTALARALINTDEFITRE